MKKFTKVVSGAALVCGLVATGAASALAGTANVGFSATMPHLQGDWNSAAQTKATANAAGSVSIASVGSNYAANVRMCARDNHNNCGTEYSGLKGGKTSTLPNKFSKNAPVVLQLHENPWAVVAVSATGSWRSN